MKIKDFIIPKNEIEVCSILKEDLNNSTFLIAGGTSLSFMKNSEEEKIAIDIRRLQWDSIDKIDDIFKIGALTTINNIMEYNEDNFMLNKVAYKYVTQQVRNIATIGGNISRVFYWCDFPVALLALDSNIILIDSNNQTEFKKSAVEFFAKQPFMILREKKSIVKFIEVKALSKKMGFSYHKEVKTHRNLSIATIAVLVNLDNDCKIIKANIALGSCVTLPCRLTGLENRLKNKNATELLANRDLDMNEIENSINLITREGISMTYCRHLIKTRIMDTLCEALKEALQ